MKNFILLFILILVGGFTTALAQTTVAGRVIDQQTLKPLAGVNVFVPNTTVGTATDTDGYFSLETSSEVLEVSFVGYLSQEISTRTNGELLNISLSPDNVLMNEIQVVGFDTNRKLQETAGAIAVVTEKDLDRTNRISLLPVLNTIPGVRMDQSNLSNARISIRGNGVRSAFGIRNLKVYVNEIPITEADGFTRIEGLDINTIERVEVIKGPASSIFGAGTGGVLNFKTQRSPYGENSLEASSTVGDFGLLRYASTYRLGTDRFNATFTVGNQQYDGYQEYSNDSRRFVTGSIQYFPNEKQTVTILLNQTRQETQLPGALTQEQFDADPRQANAGSVAQQAARRQTWTRVGVSHAYEFSPMIENVSSVYSSFYKLDHPLTFAYIRQPYQSFGGRSRMIFTPQMSSFPTTFSVGGEFVSAFVDSKRYVNSGGEVGAINFNQERTLKQYSVFYQSETRLFPSTIVTLGLSVSGVEYDITDFIDSNQTGVKTFDAELSPRIAATHIVSDALAFHASVSSGFSPPTTSEINDANGNIRDDIQAEKGINYEVGARGVALSRHLNYDVSVYSLQMEDQLIPQTVAQNTTIYNNAGNTSLKGIEASVSYLMPVSGSIFESVRPFASYAFSDYKFKEFQIRDADENVVADYSGNEVTGVSPHVASFGLDVATKHGAYLHGTYFYTGKAPIVDDNSIYNPAYSVVNVKIGYGTTLSDLFVVDIHAGADNLLDEHYSSQVALNARAFGPPGTLPAFFNPAPSRNFYVGLSTTLRLNYL